MSENVDKKSPAVHEDQRNNPIDPKVTCAPTTLSMLIQSKGMTPGEIRKGREIENEIIADIKNNQVKYEAQARKLGINPKTLPIRENFVFLAWYAKEKYGVALKYAGMNKNDWIAKALNDERPFMSSTSNGLTSFGHIVLVRGIRADKSGVFICVNDPYGRHPYRSNMASGEGVYYNADIFPFAGPDGKVKTYHTLSYA